MRLLTGMILLLLICSCKNYGKKIMYGKSELYYTTNVTEEQAKKLGDFLQENKAFPTDRRATFQLDKAKDTFLVRMVVLKDYIDNADYNKTAQYTIYRLRKDVFNSDAAVLEFCDDQLKTVKVIRPE